MLAMASTSEGRVFLGGYDGNLYELLYASRSSFSIYSPCRLSNIDMGLGGAVLKQFSPGLASWYSHAFTSLNKSNFFLEYRIGFIKDLR
jgi:hypothetical protein